MRFAFPPYEIYELFLILNAMVKNNQPWNQSINQVS